jgi:hypothetical protein
MKTLLLILWLAVRMMADDGLSCPAAVTVNEKIGAAQPGWTVTQDSTPNRLAGVTFYDGPIEQKASLVYDERRRGVRSDEHLWRFDSKNPRGYWIACSYSGTSLILSRRIPAAITRCTVTYGREISVAGLPEIQKIACQ